MYTKKCLWWLADTGVFFCASFATSCYSADPQTCMHARPCKPRQRVPGSCARGKHHTLLAYLHTNISMHTHLLDGEPESALQQRPHTLQHTAQHQVAAHT